MYLISSLLLVLSSILSYCYGISAPEGQFSHNGKYTEVEKDLPVYEYEQHLASAVIGNKYKTRPVQNINDAVIINFGVGLTQIVDLSEKNEILTTRFWITMTWLDYDVVWDPKKFANLESIRLSAELIWIPDISLYNNAESNFHIPYNNLATIYHNGTITWSGPALFKSACYIDVTYFPFDRQNCSLKLGPWTYSSDRVDMKMAPTYAGYPDLGVVDLSKFWASAEWELLAAYGIKNQKQYRSTADDVYTDVTYYLILKRLPLFYIVNIMVPCFEISAITVMIFFLPVGSFEKITLCISVLVTLTLFLNHIIEIVPPTSHVIPLMEQYLLFTTLFVTLSIVLSIVIVNICYRQPTTHVMGERFRYIFLQCLPRILGMKTYRYTIGKEPEDRLIRYSQYIFNERHFSMDSQPRCFGNVLTMLLKRKDTFYNGNFKCPAYYKSHFPAENYSPVQQTNSIKYPERMKARALQDLIFICERTQRRNDINERQLAWKFVGAVIDRIFFILFMTINVASVLFIFSLSCYSKDDSALPLSQTRRVL